jgi:hypothetical protein
VVSGLAQEAYVKTVIASFGSGARSGHSITSSAVASGEGRIAKDRYPRHARRNLFE